MLGIKIIKWRREKTNYFIDLYDNVFNVKTGKFIAIQIKGGNNGKYKKFQICHKGRKHYLTLSREKLKAFRPRKGMNKLECGHKNDNELDNHLDFYGRIEKDNLIWQTRKQNMKQRNAKFKKVKQLR